MAKKTGKVIFWGLVIGAASAGVYHYLQNKGKAAVAEEFDDFDNLEDNADGKAKDRNYIPLNLDNAKAFVSDTIDKAKEAVSKVSRKLQKENTEDDVIIDDIFDDLEDPDAKAAESDTGHADNDASDTETSNDVSDDSTSTTEDFFDDAQ